MTINSLGPKRGYKFFSNRETKFDLNPDKLVLRISSGRIIPFEQHGVLRRVRDILDGARVYEELKISFLAEDLPPFGYRVYELVLGDSKNNKKAFDKKRIKCSALDSDSYTLELKLPNIGG